MFLDNIQSYSDRTKSPDGLRASYLSGERILEEQGSMVEVAQMITQKCKMLGNCLLCSSGCSAASEFPCWLKWLALDHQGGFVPLQHH